VTLDVVDPPAGAVVSVLPASRVPGEFAQLALSSLANLAAGTYDFGVRGQAGTDVEVLPLGITLVAAAPAAVTLLDPANGAELAFPTELTWMASADATTYRVELSTSPSFDTHLVNQVVGSDHIDLPGLAGATTYYWRVTAMNVCGAGSVSQVRSFSTSPLFCSTAPLAIPDGNTTGVTSTITVPAQAGTIADVDVLLNFTHGYAGDLRATLSHGTVSERMLFAPLGTCGTVDPLLILDDAAASGVADACYVYDNADRYRPNQTLAAFNGQPLAGNWTLRVADFVAPDAGTLESWCLVPTASGAANQPPIATSLPNATVAAGAPFAYNAAAGFSDPDGDTLVYSSTTLPAWATLHATLGTISGTPGAGDAGATLVTVTATEAGPQALTASASFTLTVTGPRLFANGFEN
jgi:hypothetical protein